MTKERVGICICGFLIVILTGAGCGDSKGLKEPSLGSGDDLIVVVTFGDEILHSLIVPSNPCPDGLDIDVVPPIDTVQVSFLGDRIHSELPRGRFIGRSKDSGGRGFVAIFFENGEVVAVEGNGFEMTKLSDNLKSTALEECVNLTNVRKGIQVYWPN